MNVAKQAIERLTAFMAPCANWLGHHRHVVLTVLIAVAVYAYGVDIRLEEWPKWQTSGLELDDAYLLPTNDAYFDMTAADGGRAKQAGSLLSWMVGMGHALTGQPVTNVGMFIPVVFGPLAAIPVVLLLCWWRLYAGALAAGFFLLSTTGFLARTRMGYCDTDIYTLLLPLTLATLLAIWSSMALPLPERQRGFWGLGLRRPKLPEKIEQAELAGQVEHVGEAGQAGQANAALPNWRVPVARFMVMACACGLFAWLYPQIYASGRSIASAIVGASAVALVFTQRRQLLWAGVGFVVMGLSFYNPLWGIGALALALGLLFMPFIRQIFEAVPPLLLYGVASVVLIFLLAYFYPQIRGAMSIYANIETPIGEETVQARVNTPNTYAMISEVQRPAAASLYVFISPNKQMYWVSLAGLVVGLLRFPALFTFTPLVCLFFGSLFWGARFSMYGASLAVFFGMSLSVLEPSRWAVPWSQLAQTRAKWIRFLAKLWRTTRITLSFVGAFAVCFISWQGTLDVMKQLGPGAVLSVAHAKEFKTLDKVLEPGATLWVWWDFGLAAQYYARRDTVADGHFNSFSSTYLPAFVLSTNVSMQANRVMEFYAAHATAMPAVEDAPEHVRYHSQAMNTLMAMGQEKATAFLEGLKTGPLPVEQGGAPSPKGDSPSPKGDSPSQQGGSPFPKREAPLPPHYVAVTWEGLHHMYHMSKIGKWNLRQGGSPTYQLIPRQGIVSYTENNGVFTFNDGVSMPLDGLAVREADGTIQHVRTGTNTDLYAILNKETKEMYIMHRHMFEATYVRLLMWDARTAPVEGFTMVYDNKGAFRAFRAEFEGNQTPVKGTP